MDENNPGYKHIILHPETDASLTYAKGSYLSQYGRIESAWKFEDGNTVYEITVPANTTATLTLKESADFEIKEGNTSADKAEGVTRFDNVGTDAKFELVSGKYTFTVVGNAPIVDEPVTSTDETDSSNADPLSADQSDTTVSEDTQSDDETPSGNKFPVGILSAAGATVLAVAVAVTAIVLKKKKK